MTRLLRYWLSLVLGIGMSILLTLPLAWAAGQIADRTNVWVDGTVVLMLASGFAAGWMWLVFSTRWGDRMGDALYRLDPFGFRREREPR